MPSSTALAVALTAVGAAMGDSTVRFSYASGNIKAKLIAQVDGTMVMDTPNCVYRGNWCAPWTDLDCVLDTFAGNTKHKAVDFNKGGGRRL